MTRARLRIPVAVWLFWLLAAIVLPVWVAHDDSQWDVIVYEKAMDSLRAGHDPYTDATNIQKAHHAALIAEGQVGQDKQPPYSYVYSPMTFPALRAANTLPRRFAGSLYWSVYAVATIAAIAVAVSFAFTNEFPAILYVAGMAIFFPGLLANGTVLGGNVAYILYGAAFAAAWLGWKRDRWALFYAVVLIASCIKAPLLSLAVIPPLSARRQWLQAIVVMVAGVALFAAQPLLWPSLFKHYLEAVELQFSFNHDFGCSPAGLFSGLLYRRGLSYSPASYFVYAAYALPVFAVLAYLSRVYLAGRITLQQWAPVLLTGVILLNPRIMEYDVAPITVPMALIAWRLMRATSRPRLAGAAAALSLLAMEGLSLYSWEIRKNIDGPLILLLFLAGGWQLIRDSRTALAIDNRVDETVSAAVAV